MTTATGISDLRLPSSIQRKSPLRIGQYGIILLLLTLSLITNLNLNWVAARIFGLQNAFSTPIFVVCGLMLLNAFNTLPGSISKPCSALILSLLIYLLIGILSPSVTTDGYAQGRAIIASILILAATSHCVTNLTSQSSRLDTQILYVALVPCFLSVASIYIGLFDPVWERRIQLSWTRRLTGVFGNPNQASAQIVFLYAVAFAVAMRTGKSWILVLSLILGFPALILTQSRTTYVVLFVIAVVISRHIGNRKSSLKSAYILGCIAFVLVFAITFEYAVSNRLVHRSMAIRYEQFKRFVTGDVDSSTTSYRTVLWKKAIADWEKNPLLGQGLGSLRYVGTTKHGTHNLYVRLLGEVGIVGTLPFIFCMFFCYYSFARRDSGLPLWLRLWGIMVILNFVVRSFASDGMIVHRYANFQMAILFGFQGGYIRRALWNQKAGLTSR